MAKAAIKTAQDIQDDIFRRMPIEKKLRLIGEFSSFLLKLNRLNKDNDVFRAVEKNRWNSGKAKNGKRGLGLAPYLIRG